MTKQEQDKKIIELEQYKAYMLGVAKNHGCDSITSLAVKCSKQERRIAGLEQYIEEKNQYITEMTKHITELRYLLNQGGEV